MDLGAWPRVPLAHLPTPLEPMDRLRRALGTERAVWVKRDDATGLAGGGNKTRKLEYLAAEAKAAGADWLVTTGGVQSNHARQTAAAAARLGMGCDLVLTRAVPDRDAGYESTGNVQLDHLLGAHVQIHPVGTDRGEAMDAVAARRRVQGHTPFVIPTGGSTETGALGYVRAALELVNQAVDRDLAIGTIVVPASSGGTLAGLLVGLHALNHSARVIGIDVEADAATTRRTVAGLAASTARRLGVEPPPGERLHIEGAHAGPAYGIPTDATLAAARMAARTEGLVLDPVYSAKAMAGLLHGLDTGALAGEGAVVFVHTGGLPGLFAYPEAAGPAA
ncbi:D-cysteine desulfhydrase [Limimonas halophila]|uniref:D-cysteine desulfhydrase n=1 Tax=Limimonas halophila TaxID=1082479 RepID=A0A1G7LXD0_9PROT|nr:D-cysteine desulfhydrase family protein [Limimonas halophila]SDF54046.1 D-cysteine desulfhydrase [Limimonas halophila]